MNGTGVGFSCERQEISKLPEIPAELKYVDDIIYVEDSKLGWAKAFKKLLSSLWEGDIPTFDFTKVRPAGARLKVFGGRASGPEPLKKLFDFVVAIIFVIDAKSNALSALTLLTLSTPKVDVVPSMRGSTPPFQMKAIAFPELIPARYFLDRR